MAKDIITSSFDFIEEHILDIILVVLLLFCLVIYLTLNNVKFPKSHPELQRVVVLENFEGEKKTKETEDPEETDSKHISEIEEKMEKKAQKKLANDQPKTTSKNLSLCSGGLQDKDKSCATLSTKNSCGKIDCCVWAKKKKTKNFRCVGGDAGGATYDGSNYDVYFYKNKRFPALDSKKKIN